MKGTLTMSSRERDRLHTIRQMDRHQLTVIEGAAALKISERHCYRLLRSYRQKGDAGLIHGLRGRISNRRYSARVKAHVVELYEKRYADYGPQLYTEVLLDELGLEISRETIRLWLGETGLWKRTRKGRRHRKKRPRRPHIGDMVQVDGSHHAWFEDRGPVCCLFVFVDDASSRSSLFFAPTESEQGALESLWRYIERFGIPRQIYCDRLSVYYSLTGETNFARTLRVLGAEIIYAHSPQAKGRVERANRTHQDRLVKALREAGIGTIEEANRFLATRYLEKHNARFATTDGLIDVHRSVAGRDLKNIICFETERCVYHDMTFRFHTLFYQILPAQSLLPVPRQRVTIRHWLDGSMHVFWREQELAVVPCPPDHRRRSASPVTPAESHPWRHKPVGKARFRSVAELCRR
jgi:hypothetical protein